MEKTLLESNLERALSDLGMPLGDRVYAEDLDFDAEIADWTTDIKSTDSLQDKFNQIFLTGEKITYEQFFRGNHPFLTRRTDLYKGLGFDYQIFIEEYVGEKRPAREIADFIIPVRNFGEKGSEELDIYYNKDFFSVEHEQRHYQQLINRFYGEFTNLIASVDVSCDNKIRVLNLTKGIDLDDKENLEHLDKESPVYDILKYLIEVKEEITDGLSHDEVEGIKDSWNRDLGDIKGILDKIGDSFDGKYLDQENIGLLMNYLRELKEVV